MSFTEKLTASGSSIVKHDPKSFVVALFSLPAILTYCVGMPLFCIWQGLGHFGHGFAGFMLGVLPVLLTLLVAWLAIPRQWKDIASLSRWDWLAFAVGVTLGKWLLFMGVVLVSLFLFSATLMDQMAGAFYYYMVPLCGIEWLALALNMLTIYWGYGAMVEPMLNRKVTKSRFQFSNYVVWAVWPLSVMIYLIFQFLFYHFILP